MTTKKVLHNWRCFETSLPYVPSESVHGIVYKITDIENGKIYIGKKQIYKTVPLGKKEMALIDKIDKRKKYVKRVETDWRKYSSSCKPLVKRIAGNDDFFFFQVLYECYDETALKFMELREIILQGAFESCNGYNDNIQIKQIGEIADLSLRCMKL